MANTSGPPVTWRHRLLRGATLAALLANISTVAHAQTTTTTTSVSSTTTTLVTTHIECYRATDPLRIKGPPPSWLQLASPQVATEQCAIAGSFRLVCVPVSETITQPLERAVSGGRFEPFTPVQLPNAETVAQDRLCYRLKCSQAAAPNPATLFSDEFGARTVTKTHPYIVCGPATKTLCGDGVLDPGEDCDDGNTMDGDCCSATCHFEASGSTCLDTDSNDCTTAQCDGAGTCDQSVSVTAGTPCADTDSNDCTIAQCDGAGSCNQQNAFAVAGTGCTDTDGNACTHAQCDGAGTCNQNIFVTAGTGCPDTDGNACTLAQCNGAGTCNQNIPAAAQTTCTDTDGDQCTRAACDGAGTCDQSFFVHTCMSPMTCNPATGQCQ